MRRLLLLLAACSSTPHSHGHAARFADVASATLDDLRRFEPADGVSLGLHQYDGKLPDRSPAGLDAEVAAFTHDRETLAGFQPQVLTELEREERDTLIQNLRRALFELSELDQFHHNPMAYADAINLDAYIGRDYAPAAERAAGVIAMCRAMPAYLEQARKNVKTPIPRPWIDTALLQTTGFAEFADKDIRRELAGQPELDPALDLCKQAFTEHAAWLVAQQPSGTNDFALGTDRFLRMLAETQGIEVDLPTLKATVEKDLDRNTAAITQAARDIDPNRPVAEVVATAATDRPTPDQVIAVAQQQLAELRKFLVDNHIVTIPTDEVASVRPSPAFKRWNAAFLDGPGAFEKRKLPAFYYISPPDPAWTPEVQRAYIPPRSDLLFTSVHEVYPGHFLHSLHVHKNPSRVLQSIWFYSTGEGWAHYTEEMMYEAGAGGRTPQMHIGQLKEALLRDVRFLVAIGEHTGGMTVEQAEGLFRDRGFVDAANAHQQAVRGTFDPMFLSYTLGKLIIMKLRDDWLRQHGEAKLGDFHDAFLSHAAAPLPVIRRAMGIDTPLL